MPRPPAGPKRGKPGAKRRGGGRGPGKPARRPPAKTVPLFVATKNPGKARELAELLEDGPVRVVGPELMPSLQAPVEDGATFEANAVKKALHYSGLVEHLVLADDTGLVIDALGGKPGVRSARLGGPAATDADRVRLILHQLDGVPWEERTARFRCAVAVARRGRLLKTFEGAVEGVIAFEPEGASGFGYDPVFFYPPARKTFAEMTPEEKHRVSHRGQALARAVGWLAEWVRAEKARRQTR